MKRKSNSTISRVISVAGTTAKSWAALDALPHAVRQALWEAPVSISPESVRGLLIYGEADTVSAIEDASRREVEMFAEEHFAMHGCALPHVAAGVSFQKYMMPKR